LPETFGLAAPFARLDVFAKGCGWIKRAHLPHERIKVNRHALAGNAPSARAFFCGDDDKVSTSNPVFLPLCSQYGRHAANVDRGPCRPEFRKHLVLPVVL
jgi:hypothetical protein